MTVKEIAEKKTEAPPQIGGGMDNLPVCNITGLDISTGESTYGTSTWCGDSCDPATESMYLDYNQVTFAGWAQLAESDATKSSFFADSNLNVTNMLFSTTWANTGIISQSLKSGSTRLHPSGASGFDGTVGTECYPSGLISGSTSNTYNINDEYSIDCDWWSAGFSIKDGSSWMVPNFPFCSISGVSALDGGFFENHKVGDAMALFGTIEWGGIFGLGNPFGLDESTMDSFNNTQYGSFLW